MHKVLVATRADMNEGWVWITNNGYPPRSIIKIMNLPNNKSVSCEALENDDNSIKESNQPPRISINAEGNTIVMNGWYRNSLAGAATRLEHNLVISEANGWCGRFRATIGHPQSLFAYQLALVSVILAFK